MMNSTVIVKLKGIGPKMAERLALVGIKTVQALLLHFPLHYQDRTRVTPLRDLREGEKVLVEGEIESSWVTPRGRRQWVCVLKDGTGFLYLRFFHYTRRQEQYFQPGLRLRCFGEVRYWRGEWEMIHPETTRAGVGAGMQSHFTPVYPTAEGVPQSLLRSAITQALAMLTDEVEYLPQSLLEKFQLPHFRQAMYDIHRPSPETSFTQLEQGLHPAQQRFAFEELLAYHLSLRRWRMALQTQRSTAFLPNEALREKFLQQLPFHLTAAQQRVVEEITRDMQHVVPMLRLVQGDVGSGKTVVAAITMLQALAQGAQVAYMAPTELLADQQTQTLRGWFKPLGIEVVSLMGKMSASVRQSTLAQIASGQAAVVVGTHALFQKEVVFVNLGCVVIDEQHRFGVHQRLLLREKGAHEGKVPHQLIMTATPIPRTLAMTLYADLDVSVIDELPPGRLPVTTVVVPQQRRAEVIERIRQAIQAGRQAYWICTLVEESEVLECQAAEAVAMELRRDLSELHIGLVHGRMKSAEKEQVMRLFKQGEIHLLVATTVIEVGVDVSNASLMVIENPERLGLSQLHQLRGRVGRGMSQSHCVLLYQEGLSDLARQRLSVMRSTHDGFEIARQDLALRGPGEILGTRQAGLLRMKVAELVRDQPLLPKVQQAAELLLREYPDRVARLIERWVKLEEDYAGV